MYKNLFLGLLVLCVFMQVSAQTSALDFDGVDDRVEIAPIPAYNFGAGDFTVEANVKFDALNINGAVFTAWTANSCSNVGWGLLPENNGVMRFYIGDGSSNCFLNQASSPALNVGQCYHVAGVKSGTSMLLYIDGVVAGTGTTNLVLTGNIPVLIGQRYANAAAFRHDGTIEEARMWNFARSQTAIQSTMNSGLTGNESGLVGYWPLHDGPGNLTVADLSPGGNTGVMVGMDATTSWGTACPRPNSVPTLSQWGMLLFALLVICVGSIGIWKKQSQVFAD